MQPRWNELVEGEQWRASADISRNASLPLFGFDSPGRERLLRYCARPAFAVE